MTKKDNSSKATLKRTCMSFVAFSAGILVFELIRSLTPHRSALATTLCLMLIIILALAGALFLNERTILSRVTSGCTLLILSFIGLTFSSFPVYLLPLALGISYIGALPRFHHQPRNMSRVILYSTSILLGTLVFVIGFAYGTTFLTRALFSASL